MNAEQLRTFKELIQKGRGWLIDTEAELIGEQE